MQRIFVSDRRQANTLVGRFVTSLAVFLDDRYSRFLDSYYLWFCAQCEYRGMPQTILSLEEVVIEYIVVRNMTVVTRSHLTVCAVLPRCILRRHKMAVDARLGIVGQIGMRAGYIEQICSDTDKHRRQAPHIHLPVAWGRKKIKNASYTHACISA